MFNAALDAGWLEGVECGHTEEQVNAYIAGREGFDLEAVQNLRTAYDEMFLRPFPYLESG